MLLEMLGGALVRFAPEVLKFFDRKNERAHEALMCPQRVPGECPRVACVGLDPWCSQRDSNPHVVPNGGF